MKRRWSALVWIASMAGTLFVLGAGCTDTSGQSEQAKPPKPKTVVVEKTVEVKAESSTTEETTTEKTTSGDTIAGTAEMTCEVGQECDLGESSVTVANAEQTQAITSMGETFEGNFVVVEFDYTYGGNTSVDLGEPPFQLLDGDSNTYSLDFEATSSYGIDKDRSLIYETVQPGVSAQGTAIFEVSPEANDFTLLVADLVSPQANKTAKVPLMVGVSEPVEEAVSAEQQFISDYYDAVGREDWSATYAMLDSDTRAQFSEEEWIRKQQARENASGAPPVESATITETSEEGEGFIATVTLGYEDGTEASLPGVAVYFEDGEFKRHLTDEDLTFLRDF